MRRLLRVMAVFAASLPVPATAEDEISLSFHGGLAKQEMQGAGPHFSLQGDQRGMALEWERVPADPRAPRFGLRLDHTEYAPLDTASSQRRWQRNLGRAVTTRTDSLTVTAALPLYRTDHGALALRTGLGLARSHVRVTTAQASGHASATLPRAELSLRQTLYGPANGAAFWGELGYYTSPALSVPLSDGSTLRHETSGYRLSIGISFPLQ